MKIGCHVSIAGGVHNAPARAKDLGAECLQMFSRSPQGGKAPELTADIVASFKQSMKEGGISNAYIHTPYYINLASTEARIRESSARVIREELERGTLLGVKYIMTHLGSAKDMERVDAIQQTAEMLAKSLNGYAGTTKLLIENAAGAGAIIGDTFSEIADIMEKTGSPHIVGICLDTQHSFASGYDWRTPESFKKAIGLLDAELGIKKVKIMHANDSMVEYGTKRDRHQHIGKGYIGEAGFALITEFAEKHDIDMLLETEHDTVTEDIALLKKLRQLVR